MRTYKGYTVPSLNDLNALGHGMYYGNVYMKDPNGKSIDLGISIEDANKRGNGYIYAAAVRIINNSLNPDFL